MYPVQFISHVVTVITNRNLESVLVTEFSARRTEYEMMLRFRLSAAEYADVIVFGYYALHLIVLLSFLPTIRAMNLVCIIYHFQVFIAPKSVGKAFCAEYLSALLATPQFSMSIVFGFPFTFKATDVAGIGISIVVVCHIAASSL
jgi:hypothetical protein